MRRFRCLRVIVGILVFGASTMAGVAAAEPGNPEKGPAAPRPPVQGEDCHLRAPHRSVHDEWAHCMQVTASLSRLPAVGEEVVLRLDVRSAEARADARITVELPSNLTFVDPPGDATVRTGRSTGGVRSAERATVHADLTPGSVRELGTRIRATAAGPAHVRVRAVAETSWGTDGAGDDLFLTVGSSPGASRTGFVTPTAGGVTRASGVPAQPTAPAPSRMVPTARLPQPRTDDGAVSQSATSCASGSWHFLDQSGVLRPSINYQVQVWDDDSSSGDDLLVTGVTSFSGTYNLCFDGADGEGGGQEVFIRFISSNSLWRVRNTPAGNSDYVNSTGVQAICDGCNASFGGLMPGNDIHRGMNAFDAANDAWVWLPSTCWDGNDGACRQVVINWTATSVDGTYYSTAGNDVHLAADDPNAPSVVIHEIGHAVMDDVYEDDYPPIPNCSPHFIPSISSAGCAWTEGFAEWFPASVLNDPFFRWPDGSSLDLENPTWGSGGWSNGDSVEGRVAGALIDISDFTNEAFWDRYGEGDPGNIWTTFLNNVSDTFSQFWSQRASGGFNTGNTGANGSVYGNTIDYTFRDPLGNYAELTRPTPTPHNYSYNTTSVYWSVVATRPPSGTDYDMQLYDDVGQTVNLGGSAFGGSTIDFIAVDSNHRPLGDYYPRAYQFSGTGMYQVELAQGTDQVGVGSHTLNMGANDVALVRDTSLSPGVQTFFRVVPSSGAQNPDLFLMQSDPANSATWVRSRGSAVASSTSGGAGAAEGFSFTAPAADWYGLVLTNVTGSGNYTLHVDTSAPTGASVAINGSDTATNDPDVTLGLAASDAQTGIDSMRISTDGAMNTEPFVPFAASSLVTLPGGDGSKTVLAQFRNRAGMLSPVVSDTILLDTTGPVSTGPTPAIVQDVKLVGPNDVKVKISWSASDAATSVAEHQLQRSDDGGTTWTPVSLPSPTSTQVIVNLPRGTSDYAFRARAVDELGNVGGFVQGPVFNTLVHQQNSPFVNLTAGWTKENRAAADKGSLVTATQSGRKATLTVPDARAMGWVARMGPDAGRATVWVDGVQVATVDLYSPTVKYRMVVFSVDVAPGGSHSLQVRVLGTKNPASSGKKVTVDAFVRLL